jgi:hypothetical protein
MNGIYILAPCLVFISGCSAYQSYYGETKPMLTFAELKGRATQPNKNDNSISKGSDGEVLSEEVPVAGSSKIFLWSPKNSAAIINGNGSGCIQGAEVVVEKSGKFELSADALAAIAAKPSAGGSGDKALAVEIANAMLQLRTNSERNTFLSIGLFGLCQLAANGNLEKSAVSAAATKLIEEAARITPVPVALADSSVAAAEAPIAAPNKNADPATPATPATPVAPAAQVVPEAKP